MYTFRFYHVSRGRDFVLHFVVRKLRIREATACPKAHLLESKEPSFSNLNEVFPCDTVLFSKVGPLALAC